MKKISIVLMAILFLAPISVQAKIIKPAFLYDIRSQAMGGAGISMPRGSFGYVYNPAILGERKFNLSVVGLKVVKDRPKSLHVNVPSLVTAQWRDQEQQPPAGQAALLGGTTSDKSEVGGWVWMKMHVGGKGSAAGKANRGPQPGSLPSPTSTAELRYEGQEDGAEADCTHAQKGKIWINCP